MVLREGTFWSKEKWKGTYGETAKICEGGGEDSRLVKRVDSVNKGPKVPGSSDRLPIGYVGLCWCGI